MSDYEKTECDFCIHSRVCKHRAERIGASYASSNWWCRKFNVCIYFILDMTMSIADKEKYRKLAQVEE